jgi:hypothetical protein
LTPSPGRIILREMGPGRDEASNPLMSIKEDRGVMKSDVSWKNTLFPALFLVFSPLSASLADAEEEQPPPAVKDESEVENGWLSIATQPTVEVYVDGKKVGNTPLMDEPIQVGKHSVRFINKDMGVDVSYSINVSNKQHVTIIKKYETKKPPPPEPPAPPVTPVGTGWLTVSSSPPATVYMDNKIIGLTLLFKIPLEAGKHEVHLVNEKFDIHDHFNVTIKKGKTKKIVKKYDKKEKYGKLSVTSLPHAQVYIDGHKIGHTPISKYNLEPGNYTVTLVNDEMGINDSASITILKGKTTKIAKTFNEMQEKGTLTVTTVPWTTVYVDGKKVGNTPLLSYHLEPGQYQIKLVNKKYGIKVVFPVTITKGKNKRIERNFSKDSI